MVLFRIVSYSCFDCERHKGYIVVKEDCFLKRRIRPVHSLLNQKSFLFSMILLLSSSQTWKQFFLFQFQRSKLRPLYSCLDFDIWQLFSWEADPSSWFDFRVLSETLTNWWEDPFAIEWVHTHNDSGFLRTYNYYILQCKWQFNLSKQYNHLTIWYVVESFVVHL